MFLGGYAYASQQNSQNSPPSPTRISVWGSAYSPFRNTNTPLQDITMNQSIPFHNGTNIKSPGKTPLLGVIGGASTMAGTAAGRTMKEYEDQLGFLKKENFNLKLRIYFLEERMGITSADEDAIKKNIELKVEIESLRKELLEKQELLSQAAKAFELIEEQKEASSRNQAHYEKSLEKEQEKIVRLEKELEEYREKFTDASIYYKEAFGITPEKAIENQEKLNQMEELIASLEAEVRQISGSLNEERSWAQELESERDEFRNRLESEIQTKENLTIEKVRDIEELRERINELEEQVLKKDTIVQQHRNELNEKNRIIKEKITLLEEKCRSYEEISSVSEKRKRQIDQLRTSIKSRDDALTDLNNKHRALLSQFENGYIKRSPPSSPSTLNSFGELISPRMGQKVSCLQNVTRNDAVLLDTEKYTKPKVQMQADYLETLELKGLKNELEEKDREVKQQEEEKKQLILKLCNMQKQTEATDQKFKKMESEHEKAIKMIQGFMERQQQIESKNVRKERRILELELELKRLRENGTISDGRSETNPLLRSNYDTDLIDDLDNDHCNQQRFEDMESKINDLHDQIVTIKAEKYRLEKQIQVECEELQEQLVEKGRRIEVLEKEKSIMKREMQDKIEELDKLKQVTISVDTESPESSDRQKLHSELNLRNIEIEGKNRKIEQLTKELQIKTQNLQKLVNTELWSKNKEIAKLQNHMTTTNCQDKSRNKSELDPESANNHLVTLVKELNDIGIKVIFTNEVIQLSYISGAEPVDFKNITGYIQKLMEQKNELEKEVDYLKWLKLVSKPDIVTEIDGCESETGKIKKYCELLRSHLKDLAQFMKDMLKSDDHANTINDAHNKIVLDVLLSSKILSDDIVNAFVHAFETVYEKDSSSKKVNSNSDKDSNSVRKCRSDNILEIAKSHVSTQSDSEAFSEPDRTVSMARIGLQETQHKSTIRSRFTKHTKTFSDSEDSLDYVPYHKTYQDDLHDFDANHQIQELKEMNNILYLELTGLKNELSAKNVVHDMLDEKLIPLISKLEKSQKFCEKLQISLERRVHECYALKKESKQNSIRKAQLEKKIIDIENMAAEITKQKVELLQYKENTERKTADMLITLNKENEALRSKIKNLEDENAVKKANIATLTKELDQLTLLHSQILVENTKLSNEKLRLEQDARKTENRYDVAVRSLHDKFNREIIDLNQINDTHRAIMHELETANKELRRHVAICEASDSAPSSSGVSSMPTDLTLKQNYEDITQDYQSYDAPLPYWLPVHYPTLGGRSKSSCSPDLGIESDAAITTMRPLKDTLKITESMTNLLIDSDNGNVNREIRDVDSDSPLPIEGGHKYSLDEIETLKQENESLKRRLMKTRRALEDTFRHLSASNKNKKNVEKAITKQLMITKSILKKTRTYEEPYENS